MRVLVLTDEPSFSAHWSRIFGGHGLDTDTRSLQSIEGGGLPQSSVLFVHGDELAALPDSRVAELFAAPCLSSAYKVGLLSAGHFESMRPWMDELNQWCWDDEDAQVICRRLQWIVRTEQQRSGRSSHTSRLVNHDVNNPLTAIRILSEMLHGDITDATLRTDLDDIMEAADVATATIEAYSSLLKVRGGYRPSFGPNTDLVGMVQEVIKRPAFRNCTDNLGASGVCLIPLDSSAARAIVTDVLLNARKMTDGRSRIEVSLSAQQGSVRFTCRSVAIGLPAAVREHLIVDNGAGVLREQRLPVLSVGLHSAWHTLHALGGALTMSDAPDGGLDVICIFPTQIGG